MRLPLQAEGIWNGAAELLSPGETRGIAGRVGVGLVRCIHATPRALTLTPPRPRCGP